MLHAYIHTDFTKNFILYFINSYNLEPLLILHFCPSVTVNNNLLLKIRLKLLRTFPQEFNIELIKT